MSNIPQAGHLTPASSGTPLTPLETLPDEAIHTLIDAIPQLVWVARPDGFVIYQNQRMVEYLAMTHEQAEGAGWLAKVHPDDRQRLWEVRQTSFQTGEPYEMEHRLQDGASGAYRWFLVRAVPHRNSEGTILYWFGTCTDIEEQKRAEQRLKESEQDWRVLTEGVPQFVWRTQPDGSVEYLSQRWYDYTSSFPAESLGCAWSQFLHPDDYVRTLSAWSHAVETSEAYEIEYRLKEGQTGGYRWFLARGMPVRDETGQIIKWVGTCTDIEEQKRIEQQLKESQENWRVLAETAAQLVWTTRPDGQFEYVNQRGRDYTGFSFEPGQSDTWAYLQFIHPDDQESNRAHWQHALDTGTTYECEGRLRNGRTGEYRWFLVRAMPVRDETGQIIKWVGTCTDIEEQKRIEEALRQSQKRTRCLIDSNIIGIICIEGEEGVVVEANDAWLRMSGYSREEVRSKTLDREKIRPSDQAPLFECAMQELTARGQCTPFEIELACKDGSRLPVLVGFVLFQDHPREVIAFVLDNTAHKELERRKDDFISMASHELRNPLTVLKLQTTLLHRQLAKQGMLDQVPLASMQTQIDTITRLVEGLLDVSKIRAGRLEYVREPVDLDTLLRDIANTMQQSHPSHRILVHGSAGASLIGDRDRLEQVFTNLLSNAIKYSPGSKTVEMTLSTGEDAVTIRVRDHGLGIPREQRDKIFERFYRMTGPRPRGIPGLGMGLYIVAEIVKGHGGSITVDSEVGKGSTFTVTLPKQS